MGYGIKNRRFFLTRLLSHRVWNIALIVFSVVLLFLGHGKEDRLSGVRAVISTYTSPVLETLSKPASLASEAVEDARKLVSLKQEVDRLKDENEKLRHLQTVALQKDIKLKQLQNFLNLKVDPRISYLTSRAIANIDSPYKDSIRLNAGKENGVAKGQAVIDENGFLGQIIQVDENSARVLLISDINSRIPVRLEPGGVSAMLVGTQNNAAQLKYLPFDFDLKSQTKIFTSGEGSLLPAGILIGHVEKKQLKNSVTLLADLKHINYVKILSLKDTQQSQVTRAVMKLPPPPEKQKNLRESLSAQGLAAGMTQKSQGASDDTITITEVSTGEQTQPSKDNVSQSAGLIDLEKRTTVKKKTYREYRQRYRQSRYVGWRLRKTSRDRYWQSRAFSGNVN